MENIIWHNMSIKREAREKNLNQRGMLIWLTGLSGSGKSTIGSEVERMLHKEGYATYLLDGDNVRHGLNSDLGFTVEDRTENIRRIGELGGLFVDAGLVVIATFISPLRTDRELIRQKLGDRFIEVYINCGLETCESRDPKGLYKKARGGEISCFTGVDSVYEEPQSPEIMLRTEENTVMECALELKKFIEEALRSNGS